MALPADKDWLFWRRDVPEDQKRFSGNTFYFARVEAAKHFDVDPQRLDGKLVPEMEEPVKNRKARRAEAAQARRHSNGEGKEAPFEVQLQKEIHALIAHLVTREMSVDEQLLKSIVLGLGLASSIYAQQAGISRDAFAQGMGGYYDDISAELERAEGSTLELP